MNQIENLRFNRDLLGSANQFAAIHVERIVFKPIAHAMISNGPCAQNSTAS